MKVHGNAALGPAGRSALVEAIQSGMTLMSLTSPHWRPSSECGEGI
jgi:hypothetical protein